MRSDLQFLAPTIGADTREPAYSVTVIVCTRDRPLLLEKCLAALSRQKYSDFDVLVVDNAPASAVRDICTRWSATWVPAPVPGLTVARNVGARAARGDLIAYIDDDAIAEAGWLESLVADFSDPAVGAVSGRVRYMKALSDTRAMSDEESDEGMVRPRGSFDSATPDWFVLACFGGIGDGGNMAFRRDVIASSIAFDERLGRGRTLECGDEHVVFAALISGGYRITHNPAAVVRHPCAALPAALEDQRIHDLRSSIAHVLFVFSEFPAHRADLFRFLGRAVAKRMRPAGERSRSRPRLPRTRAFLAMLSGVRIFCRSRQEWQADGEYTHRGGGRRSHAFAGPSSTPR